MGMIIQFQTKTIDQDKVFKHNYTFITLKIYHLKWFGLTSFVHFKAKLYHTKCLNKEIVNDVTLVRDDNIQIKPLKNVQVGSMGNRDKETQGWLEYRDNETNEMAREVVNDVTLARTRPVLTCLTYHTCQVNTWE